MGNILGISDASLFKKIAYLDPLYKATMQGKFEVVDLLIKSGSIRNEEIGKSFNNAMIIETRSLDSLSEKEFNKIKKMVDLGFLSQDLFFHQMMWSSISSKNDIKWVKSLFDLGAQTRDYYLTWAIEKKNKDIVTFLLEQGAKP